MPLKPLTLLAVLLLSAHTVAQSRPFSMGFTPWPYEATQAGIDWIYNTIGAEGDILSHHMEEGVPWVEAAADSAYRPGFLDAIQYRITNTPSSARIVLSINPLNMSRDGLAPYRGDQDNMPLPAPWDTCRLNSPEVKDAYLNYALTMVDLFQPDFLLVGVEVNLLITENPAVWNDYVELHRHVYTEIKRDHPDLPVSVSVFSVPFFPEWNTEHVLQDQLDGLADIIDYVDYLSFSVHLFMSALLCDSLPSDYFDRLFALTDKPVAISESSYPAQVWQTGDPAIAFNGSPAKQDAFLNAMLNAAHDHDARHVIWFAARDFDTLWHNTLADDPLALIWRDTGLFDELGNPRTALTTWRDWFSRSLSRVAPAPDHARPSPPFAIEYRSYGTTAAVTLILPEDSPVCVELYTTGGRKVDALTTTKSAAGARTVSLLCDGAGLSPGAYCVTAHTAGGTLAGNAIVH